MLKTVEVGLLSKYRTELMGCAAILILICHGPGNGIEMPKYLEYAIVQGQIGVDIFLFLSGMGLWFSLSSYAKSNHGGIWKWYAKRYVRILVPYLIIMSVRTALVCFLDGESVWFFLSVVSTIEFWISHRAAWFVALLLPLYLLSPILFSILKKNGLLVFLLIGVLCYIIALWPNNDIGWTFFKNIQFAIIRVPVFVLGMCMAPKIKEKEKYSAAVILLMLFCGVLMLLLTRQPVYSYLFVVVPLLLILSIILDRFAGSVFNRICKFFGEISLESYLLNSFGRFILPVMIMLHIPDYNNFVLYSLVLLIGTMLSVLVHRISKPIIDRVKFH